jgi:hypothetical protein
MMYDLTKQPKWVQDEVASLEREITRLKLEVRELRSDELVEYPDDLKWKRPIGIEVDKWNRGIETLPQGSSVYFKQQRGYIEVIQCRHDQNHLQIRSSGRRLIVRPEVSNVIDVTTEEP